MLEVLRKADFSLFLVRPTLNVNNDPISMHPVQSYLCSFLESKWFTLMIRELILFSSGSNIFENKMVSK
jgi:hypothetical protein